MHLFYKGFSAIELLTVLLVAGIVLSLSVPSFGKALARSRQSAEINALFHALYLARKESIRRKTRVSLCPSRDGSACAPGRDWSRGWILFENTDRDEPPVNDPGEPVILVHSGGQHVRIEANRHGFTSRGTRKRATNGTLVFCDVAGRIPARALVISYTGRPRVADTRRGGETYACSG
ncbi:MAG: GspH/FimT family pseudopilin [Pseudomonadota bacterium]